MSTDTDSEGADRSRLRGLALPSIVAAAGAGIGWILSSQPRGLRGAIAGVPESAQELAGDLKERVESFVRSTKSQASGGSGGRGGGSGNQIDGKELEARRRERKKRRERRRQKATT